MFKNLFHKGGYCTLDRVQALYSRSPLWPPWMYFSEINKMDEQYGYHADFVQDVPDSLKCVVCHLVMRQPVQIMACGHRLCMSCFQRIEIYAKHLYVTLKFHFSFLYTKNTKKILQRHIAKNIFQKKLLACKCW